MTSPGVTNDYDVYSKQEDCQRAHEMIDLLYTAGFETNNLCIQEQFLKTTLLRKDSGFTVDLWLKSSK